MTPNQNKICGRSFDSQTSSTTIKLEIPLKRVAPTSDHAGPPSKLINIPTSAPNQIQQCQPINLLNTNAGAHNRKSSTNQLQAVSSSNPLISPLYPITYHMLLPNSEGDFIVEWRKKLIKEGMSSMFEYLSTNCCSCHRIIPATQPHPTKYSSYSQWVTAPRSSYNPVEALNSYNSTHHCSSQYSVCKSDVRCSPTHSAYWKLAHGRKDTSVMSLPISRIHSQMTAKIEQSTQDIKPLLKTSGYKTPSSVAKFVWPTTVVQTATTSTVIQPKAKPVESSPKSCQASVIVTPKESISKQLHRSQSTPSSAAQQTTAEIKQKFITGGFKSEEEYVYVRGRGRGKYVCQQCGIRCKKPSMLKKHIRTHTDLRPYSCGHCNFSFKTKGNLTKHMKSKAHHRRCLELGIYPVPTSVDDTQIDETVLATQQKLSRDSKIMGKSGDNSEDGSSDDDSDSDDTSTGEDNSNMSDDSSGNLQIDEGETMNDEDEKTKSDPAMNPAVLRRVQSMPAHRKQNSLDQANDTIRDTSENNENKDHKFITPPPKKRRKLSKLVSGDSKDSSSNSFSQRSSMDEELAQSLLALSNTPVHRNSVEQPIAPKPEQLAVEKTSQHVSVVRAPLNNSSTVRMIASKPSTKTPNDYNEPIDLSNKGETIPNTENRLICHLCRAIHDTQDSLTQHMEKHNVSSGRTLSKLKRSLSSQDRKSSMDGNKSVPSSPSIGQLKRQFAFSQSIKDDAEQMDISNEELTEPPRKSQEKTKTKTCPYCQKRVSNITEHITRNHPDKSENKSVNSVQDEPITLSLTSPEKTSQSIPCQVCDRVFKNTSGLKQHLVSHAELRPYICEYCDAGFTTAMHLKNHLKTHTQERPYICGECGSTFARPDHLKQHSKTHRKPTFENCG